MCLVGIYGICTLVEIVYIHYRVRRYLQCIILYATVLLMQLILFLNQQFR